MSASAKATRNGAELRAAAEAAGLDPVLDAETLDLVFRCPACGDRDCWMTLAAGDERATASLCGERPLRADLLDLIKSGPAEGPERQLRPAIARQEVVAATPVPSQEQAMPAVGGSQIPQSHVAVQDASEAGSSGKSGPAERWMVGLLALLFLCAGLAAAALSAFANYSAFAATVADPLQGRVWGLAGVIASIVSFGGFTFVWWHAAAGRRAAALQAFCFALVGASASVLGTRLYVDANNRAASAPLEQARAEVPLLEARIAEAAEQLGAVPPGTRTVDGLEGYLAEVERVGRSHQKPYRDALVELGQARRREALERQLAEDREQLARLRAVEHAPAAMKLPPTGFAVALELFSSQATSIGFLALLVLARRRV